MRKNLAILFAVLIFSGYTSAQSGFHLKTRSAADLFADQRRVVGSWCRQDFEGLRLTTDGWQRFKPLTTFRHNPDFTGIVIVSRYQVPERDAPSWNFDVNYWVLGRFDRSAGYSSENGMSTVTFTTKEIDGDILITNFDPMNPYVSKRAAVEWMKKELELSNTSDLEKIHLRQALKVLDPAESQTTPSPNNPPAKP